MNKALLFVALAIAVTAAAASDLPKMQLIPDSQAEELRQALIAAGGCNGNICFAIDGSSSIDAHAFTNMKNFVLDATSIMGVDNVVEFSAVQYSTITSRISPLTVDRTTFVKRVKRVTQRGGHTFLTGGLNYCFRELFKRPFDANKIVILGDGNNNIGSSDVRRANLFRRYGGVVAVVAAGQKANRAKLLRIAGNNPLNQYEVTSFLDVLGLSFNLDDLVLQVCKHH